MSEEIRNGIPKAEVVGKRNFTPEEKDRYEKGFSEILRQHGILKDGQTIKDLKKKK